MRANTKDGRREWWEGSGVKVRHACVVASGYSPYFLCGYSLCIISGCTIVMSGTCANVMDSCPIRKSPNPYLYP